MQPVGFGTVPFVHRHGGYEHTSSVSSQNAPAPKHADAPQAHGFGLATDPFVYAHLRTLWHTPSAFSSMQYNPVDAVQSLLPQVQAALFAIDPFTFEHEATLLHASAAALQ